MSAVCAAKPPMNRIQLSRAVAAASQMLAASRAGAAAAPLPPQPAAPTVAPPPSEAEREAARTRDARVAKVGRALTLSTPQAVPCSTNITNLLKACRRTGLPRACRAASRGGARAYPAACAIRLAVGTCPLPRRRVARPCLHREPGGRRAVARRLRPQGLFQVKPTLGGTKQISHARLLVWMASVVQPWEEWWQSYGPSSSWIVYGAAAEQRQVPQLFVTVLAERVPHVVAVCTMPSVIVSCAGLRC